MADKLKEYIHEHLKKGHHPEHIHKHVVSHGHHPGVVQKHIKSYYRKRTIILLASFTILLAVAAGIFIAADRYGRGENPFLELTRAVYFPLASPVEKIGITSDDRYLFTLDVHERQTQYQIDDNKVTTLAVSFPENNIPVGTFAHPETDKLKCRVEEGHIKVLYKPEDVLLRTLKADNYTQCFFSFSKDRLFSVSDKFVSIYSITIVEP